MSVWTMTPTRSRTISCRCSTVSPASRRARTSERRSRASWGTTSACEGCRAATRASRMSRSPSVRSSCSSSSASVSRPRMLRLRACLRSWPSLSSLLAKVMASASTMAPWALRSRTPSSSSRASPGFRNQASMSVQIAGSIRSVRIETPRHFPATGPRSTS